MPGVCLSGVQWRGLEWPSSILQISAENRKATWFDDDWAWVGNASIPDCFKCHWKRMKLKPEALLGSRLCKRLFQGPGSLWSQARNPACLNSLLLAPCLTSIFSESYPGPYPPLILPQSNKTPENRPWTSLVREIRKWQVSSLIHAVLEGVRGREWDEVTTQQSAQSHLLSL